MHFPSPYFVAFEVAVAVTFVICLRDARQRGAARVLALCAGVVFGVLLELATIRQLHAYRYGTFTVMVLDVPLVIGVAWGTIVYSARAFSDAADLPAWARPVMDGLIALNLDLAMDAVAIRLGMWDWGIGLRAAWFGVPWANFWAWFWVVFSFSSGWRLGERLPGRAATYLAPVLALVVGLAGVLGTNALITFVVPGWLYRPIIALVLFGALAVVLVVRPRLAVREVPVVARAVPAVIHVYFLVAGIVSGALFAPAWLCMASVLMAAAAACLHRSPRR
ncbi:MAG: carotenoid biosynthesis protein [Deltaproteobacteria bacterium]